jgi:hypothetical protein
MPISRHIRGWWPNDSDPRVLHAHGTCRHGVSCTDRTHGDAARSCKLSLLNGAPPWLRLHVRERLPKPWRLSYAGGWNERAGQAAWDRTPIPATMRRAYVAMTASDRSTYLDSLIPDAALGRPTSFYRRTGP